MEPNRFDDVEVRIVEEHFPPRKRERGRLGRTAIALTATLALTGSLAAGASALTSTAQAPTRTVVKSHVAKQGHQSHGLCHRGEGHRQSATALDY